MPPVLGLSRRVSLSTASRTVGGGHSGELARKLLPSTTVRVARVQSVTGAHGAVP